MIKIAFVIDTIESPTAGTEKQLLMLIKHLDRSRFQPILCVLRSSQWLEEEFDSCPLYVAGIDSFKSIRGWCAVVRLALYFRAQGVQVVQTHFRDSSIAGILAARVAGINAIVATRRNQGYWLTPTERQIQAFLNRWVTVFVANSLSTKQWAVETEGLAPERVQVIYNGIDLNLIEKFRNEDRLVMRQALDIRVETTVVGIVANLRPVKGIDVFLKAAAIVRRHVSDVRFLVVGEGHELHSLEALSRKDGLQGTVSFLGRREDVGRLLTAFDVGVLSSHSESLSNAVVEYLAAGLPVVCTDVGGCREAIEGDGRGAVVAVNDHVAMGTAIIEVLMRQGKTRNHNPSEWVRKSCNLPLVIGKYNDLYARLAGP